MNPRISSATRSSPFEPTDGEERLDRALKREFERTTLPGHSEADLAQFLERHVLTPMQRAEYTQSWYATYVRRAVTGNGVPAPEGYEGVAARMPGWLKEGKLTQATFDAYVEEINVQRLQGFDHMLDALRAHPERAEKTAELARGLVQRWQDQGTATEDFLHALRVRLEDAFGDAAQVADVASGARGTRATDMAGQSAAAVADAPGQPPSPVNIGYAQSLLKRLTAGSTEDVCARRNPDTRYPVLSTWGSVAARFGGNENSETDQEDSGLPDAHFALPSPDKLQESVARSRRDVPSEVLFFDPSIKLPDYWPYPAKAYTDTAFACVEANEAPPGEVLAVTIGSQRFDPGGRHGIKIDEVRPATDAEIERSQSAPGGPSTEDPLLYSICHSKHGCTDVQSVGKSIKEYFDAARELVLYPPKMAEVMPGNIIDTHPLTPRVKVLLDRPEGTTVFVRARPESRYGLPQWARNLDILVQTAGYDQRCLPTPVGGDRRIVAGPRAGEPLTDDTAFYCPDDRIYVPEQPQS